MNPIHAMLIELGISDAQSIRPYYPRVRDRDDVAVMRCERSGVIVLDRADHMEPSYYKDKKGLDYWGESKDRQAILDQISEDTASRAAKVGERIRNRRWLDVGAGVGGVLDRLAATAKEAHALEPQPDARRALEKQGYRTYQTLEAVPDGAYDVITLFHVFEHIFAPLDFLRTARAKLAEGGVLMLEVPHARDFLISILNVESFKKATFWSEHLILHTRASLERCLHATGYCEVAIEGHQRYPLANHLHWLAEGKGNGHIEWNFLRDEKLDSAYESMLDRLDHTDTLIAWASVG